MRIRIYLQPDIKDAFWVRMSKKALSAEILRKRYTAVYLEAPTVSEIPLEEEFGKDEKRILIYVGNSFRKTPADLRFLAENKVHTVLINNGSYAYPANCSRVILNYRDAVEKAITYFSANGRDRIALFGINPSSPTDKIMEARFVDYLQAKGEFPHRDIYYNYASAGSCYDHFKNYSAAYNAVICANDMIALTLLRRLQADGVRVPEDMYLLSCGLASLLAEQPSIPITTVSVDREEVGTQAILAYTVLAKSTSDLVLRMEIAAKLSVRASTAFAPVPEQLFLPPSIPSAVDFFADPAAQNFYNAENLLTHCDDLDLRILDQLLIDNSYTAIAEHLFTSVNMISYRVKRMCRLAGCTDRAALLELLKPYFD